MANLEHEDNDGEDPDSTRHQELEDSPQKGDGGCEEKNGSISMPELLLKIILLLLKPSVPILHG